MSTLVESMSLLGGVAPLSTTNSSSTQESNSQFKWNGRTVGLAVGTGVLVITCVALGVLVNPLFFGAIPFILGASWGLMGAPTLNDLLSGPDATTPKRQPLLQENGLLSRSVTPTPELSPLLTLQRPATYGSTNRDGTIIGQTHALPDSDDESLDDEIGPPPSSQIHAGSSSASFTTPPQLPIRTEANAKARELIDKMNACKSPTHDMVCFRTMLRDHLSNYNEFTDEFLGCALKFYSIDEKTVPTQSSPSDNLTNIAHNISLCEGIIKMVPDTERGRTFIGNFRSRIAELEQQRNHILLELQTHAKESAKHLGQKVFPGEISGHSAGLTLSGEVDSLLQQTPLKQINENIAMAETRIADVKQKDSNTQSTIRFLESEIQGLQARLSQTIDTGKLPSTAIVDGREVSVTIRDQREEYSLKIAEIERNITENTTALSQITTRKDLLPLVKERYELELALLQTQYQYEALCTHYTLQQDPSKDDISGHLQNHIRNLVQIREKVDLLSKNMQTLESEIKQFQTAVLDNNENNKERARKNIARLIADPYSTEVLTVHILGAHGSPTAKYLHDNVLKKGWLDSKTPLGQHLKAIDYLPFFQGRISQLAAETDTKLAIFTDISTSVSEIQFRIKETTDRLQAASLTSIELSSEQTRAEEALRKAQRSLNELNRHVNNLSNYLKTICSQQVFTEFVDNYKAYALASKIPQNLWAVQILGLLSEHFSLLEQFPELQKLILDALKRNGIDPSTIQPRPRHGAAFVAMISSSSSSQPTFDDSLEGVRKFMDNSPQFFSSSSSCSSYPADKIPTGQFFLYSGSEVQN